MTYKPKIWTDKVMHALSKHPLFNKLNEREILEHLNALEAYLKIYQPNETIIKKNEKQKTMGLVLSGRIKLYTQGQVYLGTQVQSKGYLIGLKTAFDAFPKNGIDAMAETKTEILFFNIPKIKDAFLLGLLSNYSKFLDYAEDEIRYYKIKGLKCKIAAYLLMYVEKEQIDTNQAFQIKLSRQEIADLFHVSRPSISRELSSMQQQGYLTCRLDWFTINAEKLKELFATNE